MKKIILISLCFTFFISIHLIAQGIDKPRYQIITHRGGNYLGTFKLELFPLIAPNHTHNFDSLALALAFDSTAFHRVVPAFVIQGGDPNSLHGPVSTWGQGNVNQPTVNAEFSAVHHQRGIIGAARDANINSATSQFYICVASNSSLSNLDGQYTVYGKVTEGMEVVDTIVNSPRNANDVPLQKIEMFVTYIGVNDTIPAAPILITPADSGLNVGYSQNFQWANVNGGVLYTIEFSADSLFSTLSYIRKVGVNSSIFPNMVGNTTYYWRVKANNGGHESGYSAVRSFSTKAAPQLIFPADLDTGIILTPICKWTTIPGATSYLLQIASNTSFSAGSLVYFQSGITDTIKQASGLSPNTTYYWRVRGNQGVNQGLSSHIFSFKTGLSVGIKELNPKFQTLDIKNSYPVPAKNELVITLASTDSGKSLFTLVDGAGKNVLSENKNVLPGEGTYKLNVNSLKKGIYFLKVELNTKTATRKIEIE